MCQRDLNVMKHIDIPEEHSDRVDIVKVQDCPEQDSIEASRQRTECQRWIAFDNDGLLVLLDT